MKILLVEDERDIAHFIINGLKVEHFTVDWAESGAKGLMWAKVNPYDVAIIDINLGQQRERYRYLRGDPGKGADVSDHHAVGCERRAYKDRGTQYRRG